MSDHGALRSAADALAVARHVQTGRIRTIAENIANADSTAPTPGGAPYARKVAVFGPVIPDAPEPTGRVARGTGDIRSRYEPWNAVADAAGLVRLPGVDASLESADLQSAIRSYQLNLEASAAIDTVSRETLDLLR